MLRAVISFLIVPAALCSMLVSCSKGDQGPAGPAGPAGAQGATGTQGPAGSANVIYSQWFTPPTYVKDTVFSIWGFYYNKATTDITQQVLDSGMVLTYGKLDGYNTLIWPTNQVAQLPITVTYIQAGTQTDTWQAYATPGNLRITFVNDNNYWTGISNAHQFRYIIIPGAKKSTVAGIKPGIFYSNGRKLDGNAVNGVVQNYKQMSYEQVCQRLGIDE